MAPVGGKIWLQAKEALALMNGSTFSTALAALVIRDAQNLLATFEIIVALTLEGHSRLSRSILRAATSRPWSCTGGADRRAYNPIFEGQRVG